MQIISAKIEKDVLIMKSNGVHIFLAVLLLLCQFLSEASPARKTDIVLQQPDGSTFRAILKGDEFAKILTDIQGNPIIQDQNGWYCYAEYSSDGSRSSTGCRVGNAISGNAASYSRDIPYDAIYEKAAMLRHNAVREEYNVVQRMKGATGSWTKSGTPARKHGIVLLVQFPDLRFKYSRDDFITLLHSGRDGNNGAETYFNDQFGGLLEFSFDVSSIVTVSKSYRYYGQNRNNENGTDAYPAEMVKEACILADDEIDFSGYDDDRDGTVDNIFIFYAGPDEAEGAGDFHIWSHSWYLSSGTGRSLSLDGVKIDRYACTSELSGGSLAGIGTFCHEYSHTLGLPDLYDTDYMGSGGLADALWGSTSLMDSGNTNDNGHTPPYFNAIEREILGMAEAVPVTESGTYRLSPINESMEFYRIDGEQPGEYYLFECRAEEGWDRYSGGSGMLIYHIDKSGNDAGNGLTAFDRWQVKSNSVNCNPEHQCADLIEASRPVSSGTDGASISSIFFPYGDIDAFNSGTVPSFTFWNGDNPPFEISGITRDGRDIIFNVTKSSSADIPVPLVTKSDIFQDAAIISWSIDLSFQGDVMAEWGRPEEEKTSITVKPYSTTGNVLNYAIVLDSLTPGTGYDVRIFCRNSDGTEGNAAYCSFTTKQTVAKGKPYMYLRYMERNDDGSFPIGSRFPLRLYNATDAAEIRWSMDEKPVKSGNSGYFIPSSSGRLKAVITYENGSTDTVVKDIIIGKE